MRKKIKAKKKPSLINRRQVGVRVIVEGLALPQMYCIYEEQYEDGSTKTVRGFRIYGAVAPRSPTPHKNLRYRPDLTPTIQACHLLLRTLEQACYAADEKLLPKPTNR